MIALPQIELKNPVLTPQKWNIQPIVDPLVDYMQQVANKNDAIEKQKREEILRYGIYATDPIKFNSIKLQQDAIKDRDNWMNEVSTTVAKYKSRGKQIPSTEIVKWQSGLTLINDKIKLNNGIQSQAQDAVSRLAEDYDGKIFNHDETKKALADWQKNGYYDPANGFLRDADANIPSILQSTKAARTTTSTSKITDYNKSTGEYIAKTSSSEGDENESREIFRTVTSTNPNVQKKLVKEWNSIEQYAQANPDIKLPELGNKTLNEYKQAYTSWAGNNPQLDLGIAAKYGEDKYWPQARLNVKEGVKEGIRGGGFGIQFGGAKYRELTPAWGKIEGKAGMPMQIINRTERPDLSNVGGDYIDPETGQTIHLNPGVEKQLYGFNTNRGDKGYYAVVVKIPTTIDFESDASGMPVIFNKETKTSVSDKEVGAKGQTMKDPSDGKVKAYATHIFIGDKQYPNLKSAQYDISKTPELANNVKLVTTIGGIDQAPIPLEVKMKKGQSRNEEKVLYKKIDSDSERDMISRNDVSKIFYRPLDEPTQSEKPVEKPKTPTTQEVWDKAKLDRYYQHIAKQTGKGVTDPKTKKLVDDYLKSKNIVIE